MRAADRHHGHAIRHFLESLVEARLADESALKAQIRKLIRKFRTRAGVDANDGSATRVADAFGLVFAAGELARRYGILPSGFTTGAAALSCYRLHLEHAGEASISFGDRLCALASDGRVVALKKQGSPARAALAYLQGRKAGKELLVPVKNITVSSRIGKTFGERARSGAI